ncbi:MAG: IS1380 family transposase [Magnetococcales bacterium]|nr:IS1380 family transposase [Magnetococcales bacterium]
MTECTPPTLNFPACKRRAVQAEFSGDDITSDGGLLLIRQADRLHGLCERVAASLPDQRDQSRITHKLIDLVRQRIFGIAAGYEDLNDHEMLRKDPAFQTSVNRDTDLASSATLCRLENSATSEIFWKIQNIMVDHFMDSFTKPPDELILDFDATDDPVHGLQVGRFFHGYYDEYCFLPLYVFCGDQLLVSYLRTSGQDGAKHAGAILRWLVNRFRQKWPNVRIIFRADSGFCRARYLSWCERNRVDYVIGLTKNPRLERLSAFQERIAEAVFNATGRDYRLIDEIEYGSCSWKQSRRVIVRAHHSAKGKNPRFVVTNLEYDPTVIYDDIYCQRGEAENRIKEQQLCLFADRTSCHDWWPNQLRLFFSSIAYILLETIRRTALYGTNLAHARCDTIRLKLIKIGAVILRNTRRVRFLLSSANPNKELFFLVARRLASR